MNDKLWDAVILGAGAAGLMCALTAGQRGRSVLLIDHAKRVGEKIRISGGGRCNFTNLHSRPGDFLSDNPKFCRSALAGYGPQDFIDLVAQHGIAWHEKTLGQLFCDGRSQAIIDMLLAECAKGGVTLRTGTDIRAVSHADGRFCVNTSGGKVLARQLVAATGGKSIPKMGATGLAYDLARQFGLSIVETRPALVPLTLAPQQLAEMATLPGVSADSIVSHGKTRFREAMLFTHRGLSGPAVLQISSYWREGDDICIDFLAGEDAAALLMTARQETPRQKPATVLAGHLPRRLVDHLLSGLGIDDRNMGDLPDKALRPLAERLNRWRIRPAGSEGYRTAEVTLGGVDTKGLDSRTMQAKTVPGLYVIGEAVDVTGHLGGHNFQWAWASGAAAGRAL